jgi:mannose-1-phosphate guanylyltransferase/mannose-6-phosphate isomerase
MSLRISPVLLCGGAGTRLWPISRDALPKQFLRLCGDHTTYQQALLRVSDPAIFDRTVVITSAEFRFFARRQAEELGIDPIILVEPTRRDSGPAVAAGALLAQERDPHAIVLAVAADHVILDPEAFHSACVDATAAAQAGHIVMFGLRPTDPKTSYGYILPGELLDQGTARTVAAFVEKPDARTAMDYVSKGYLWNSGNFLFRSDVLLEELGRHAPALLDAVQASVRLADQDIGFVRLDSASFSRAPQTSIDYALMQHTDRAAVVEGTFRWSDIGSWDALFDVAPCDAHGNLLRGAVVAVESDNCIVHSEDRLVAVLGAKDLIVVSTADAVLVVPRSRAQDVRALVTKLKGEGRREAIEHRLMHRPWGHYDSVDRGERFQVKRIVVRPGGTLSLQQHMHRSEHWVVVRGTAEVTLDGEVRHVHENESIYIPIGTIHRLANPGKIPLEIIEVQTGSYLGEDDIIRFEDVYGRSPGRGPAPGERGAELHRHGKMVSPQHPPADMQHALPSPGINP